MGGYVVIRNGFAPEANETAEGSMWWMPLNLVIFFKRCSPAPYICGVWESGKESELKHSCNLRNVSAILIRLIGSCCQHLFGIRVGQMIMIMISRIFRWSVFWYQDAVDHMKSSQRNYLCRCLINDHLSQPEMVRVDRGNQVSGNTLRILIRLRIFMISPLSVDYKSHCLTKGERFEIFGTVRFTDEENLCCV